MFVTLRHLAALARKELSVLRTLHREVQAKLDRLTAEDPELDDFLTRADGFAVFPSVGKAAAVAGAAFGMGEVFRHGRLVGYAGMIQATLGAQIGGHTFTEIIAFQDRGAFNRFCAGSWNWTAGAAAVVVTTGAVASADYEQGVAVFVRAEGGLMLEGAVGAQKIIFRPAVLGRARSALEQA